MASSLLKFVEYGQEMPEARPADERVGDFAEIYRAFAADKVRAQAARCSQCGVPFCQNACPLANDIPDWLMLAADGRWEDAYRRASATNPMPEICGRICPQDRLCEGACVIEQSGHGAVTIGAVERFLTEEAFRQGWITPLRPRGHAARPENVAIIGAGPAGLAAAALLREEGFGVTVYDRHDRAGGLLAYGIPNFKLDKAIVARRVALLAEAGVEFKLNCDVGRDIAFEDVQARFAAVLIATGVYRARALGLGAGDPLAVPALDYLIASQRAAPQSPDLAAENAALSAAGQRVIVIGGGDTAMDCVRTAVRQGASAVTCLYRRDRDNMPGSRAEIRHAEAEGVAFEFLAAPIALSGNEREGFVLTVQRMQLGARDANGRRMITPIAGAVDRFGADRIVSALGFDPEDLPKAFRAPGLATHADGRVRVIEGTYTTALPDVYAAGDIVRGASLVVWALKEGREAAAAIARDLKTRPSPGAATTTLIA